MAEAPQVQPIDTLLSGRNAERAIQIVEASSDTKLQAAAALAKERKLHETKEKGVRGTSRLEASRRQREARFSPRDAEGILLRQGADRATREGSTLKIDDTGLEPGEKIVVKENLKSTEAALKSITGFLKYADVVTEAQATGKTIDRAFLHTKGIRSEADWNKLRQDALDNMLSLPIFQQQAPELAGITDPALRREFIEVAIANDPALRAKVTEKMREIQQRSRDLPDVKKDAEYDQAVAEKKAAEARQQDVIVDVATAFADANLELGTPDEMQEHIQKLVATGMSAKDIVGELQAELIAPREIQALLNLNDAQAKYDAAEKAANASMAGKTPEAQQRIRDAFDLANTELTAVKGLLSPTEFEEAKKKLDRILRFTDTRQSGEGAYASPVASMVNEAVRQRKTIQEKEKIIRKKEATASKAERESRADRFQAESDLIADLENVMNDSVYDVWLDRQAESERRFDIYTHDQEEEAKKTGDKAVEDAVKKVGEKMKKHWIEYNEKSRTRTPHHEQMGKDMKFLAYHGPEGIKQLVARDLDLTILLPHGSVPPTTTYREGMDLSLITNEEDKKKLEQAFEKYGQTYQDKLMHDFFASRRFRDKFDGEAMNLKDHEWQLLYEQFGSSIDAKIDSQAESREMQRKLQEMGLASDPNMKKWLYRIALLGAVVGSTITGVAPVAAIGTAAVGMGSLALGMRAKGV